jgi:hypothetical protein
MRIVQRSAIRALLALVVFSRAALAIGLGGPTPLAYTTTFQDATGAPVAVTFQGQAQGSALTGSVQAGAIQEQVTGTIGPDGSVSGQLLAADGTKLGVFWAQPGGLGLKGSYDLNGRVGDFTVPVRLPVPVTLPPSSQ